MSTKDHSAEAKALRPGRSFAAAPLHVVPATGEVPSQLVQGEVDVEATLSSAKYANIDDLAQEADAIWEEVKKANISVHDHTKTDELLKRLQQEHKDFQTSFPVPMRWSVQRRAYSSSAFRKFLQYYQSCTKQEAYAQAAEKTKGRPPTVFTTRRKFLETQAEYIVFLFKESRSLVDGFAFEETKSKLSRREHVNTETIKKLRSWAITALEKEDEDFRKCQEATVEAVKKQDARFDMQRRQELLFLLRKERQAAAASAAAPTAAASAAPTAAPTGQTTA